MMWINRIPVVGAVTAAAVLCMNAGLTARCDSPREAPPAAASPKIEGRARNAKHVSLYEVPLVCPAVPEIGCGSMAKPLLLELEGRDAVSEAWLKRSGTLLAVVWSEHSTASQRRSLAQTLLEQREVTAKELKGAARKQALKDFQSGSAWYRGAEVDRLSEEEAGILAARWVGRVGQKVKLNDQTAQALHGEFENALRRKLTGQITRLQLRQEMLRAGREHLEEKDVAVLLDAFKTELQLPKEEQ
jgi:hypothetical protein